MRRPSRPTLLPYTTLFRSRATAAAADALRCAAAGGLRAGCGPVLRAVGLLHRPGRTGRADGYDPLLLELRSFWHEPGDRKSTRLNSSHANISYAVFCLKKK